MVPPRSEVMERLWTVAMCMPHETKREGRTWDEELQKVMAHRELTESSLPISWYRPTEEKYGYRYESVTGYKTNNDGEDSKINANRTKFT